MGRPPKNGKAKQKTKEKENKTEGAGAERRGKELFTREPLGPRGSASLSAAGETQGPQVDAQTQMALLSSFRRLCHSLGGRVTKQRSGRMGRC